MNHQQVRILFTGRYQPDYNRTLILLAGLSNLGAHVIQFPFSKKNTETRERLRQYNQEVDFVFMPCFTHTDVLFVRKNTRKLLVFDPLISKYLTKVHDYRQIFHYSPRALKNYLKDRIAVKMADIIIADTEQNRLYYHRILKVPLVKTRVIPVGADIDRFYPTKRKDLDNHFLVGFYGGFIPLHGVGQIVEAARQLSEYVDIRFEIVGNGFEENKVKQAEQKDRVRCVTFSDNIPYDRLNDKINGFDLCLGVFGNGIKTGMVVPNKVFHYAACGKCIITKDTPAIREVFTHSENIFLCNGTPKDIAASIVYLKENPEVRMRIATNARQLIVDHHSQNHVARKLLSIFEEYRQA